MKNSKSVHQQIQDLKKNVANQSQQIVDIESQEEGAETLLGQCEDGIGSEKADYHGALKHDTSAADTRHQVVLDKKKFSMMGTEMVVSTGISYALAWGIGQLFTLSSFWRIIIGSVLSFAVNGLAVYRIIKKC